jgi:hypothetical protein
MNGAKIECNGTILRLSETELEHGERAISSRLDEIRETCPTLRILEDLSPIPIRLVEIQMLGIPCPMYVDPLGILDRIGYKAGIPPEVERRMAELDVMGDWVACDTESPTDAEILH